MGLKLQLEASARAHTYGLGLMCRYRWLCCEEGVLIFDVVARPESCSCRKKGEEKEQENSILSVLTNEWCDQTNKMFFLEACFINIYIWKNVNSEA